MEWWILELQIVLRTWNLIAKITHKMGGFLYSNKERWNYGRRTETASRTGVADWKNDGLRRKSIRLPKPEGVVYRLCGKTRCGANSRKRWLRISAESNQADEHTHMTASTIFISIPSTKFYRRYRYNQIKHIKTAVADGFSYKWKVKGVHIFYAWYLWWYLLKEQVPVKRKIEMPGNRKKRKIEAVG